MSVCGAGSQFCFPANYLMDQAVLLQATHRGREQGMIKTKKTKTLAFFSLPELT